MCNQSWAVPFDTQFVASFHRPHLGVCEVAFHLSALLTPQPDNKTNPEKILGVCQQSWDTLLRFFIFTTS